MDSSVSSVTFNQKNDIAYTDLSDIELNTWLKSNTNLTDEQKRQLLTSCIEKGYPESLRNLLNDNEGKMFLTSANKKTALILAIEKGHLEIVKALLEKFKDLDYQDSKGQTPLALAIERGNLAVINALLDQFKNLDYQDSKGQTPLALAIEKGKLEVINALLEKGANLNARDKNGNTPLILAIQQNNIAIFNALLEKGASVHYRDNNNNTPLMLAVEQNNIAIVNTLLKKEHVALNGQNKDQKTALMLATEKGYLKIVKALLAQKDVLVELKDKFRKKTALMLAIEKGHLEIVKALLVKDTNLNAKDKNDNTPLMLAVQQNNIAIVNAILSKNPDNDNLKNSLKASPINIDIPTVIIQKIWNDNINNESRSNLLNECLSIAENAEKAHPNQYISLLKNLIEKTDINTQPELLTLFQNALTIAQQHVAPSSTTNNENKAPESVNLSTQDLILEEFKKYRVEDKALILAKCIEQNKKEYLTIYLNDPNIRDVINYQNKETGNTPLMLAVQQNNIEIVNTLLEKEHIALNSQNKDQKTALMLALEIGNIEIIAALIVATPINIADSLTLAENKLNLPEYINLLKNLSNNEKMQNNEYALRDIQKALNTCLINAASKGDLASIRMIINTPDILSNESLITAWDKAHAAGNITIANQLLSRADNNIDLRILYLKEGVKFKNFQEMIDLFRKASNEGRFLELLKTVPFILFNNAKLSQKAATILGPIGLITSLVLFFIPGLQPIAIGVFALTAASVVTLAIANRVLDRVYAIFGLPNPNSINKKHKTPEERTEAVLLKETSQSRKIVANITAGLALLFFFTALSALFAIATPLLLGGLGVGGMITLGVMTANTLSTLAMSLVTSVISLIVSAPTISLPVIGAGLAFTGFIAFQLNKQHNSILQKKFDTENQKSSNGTTAELLPGVTYEAYKKSRIDSRNPFYFFRKTNIETIHQTQNTKIDSLNNVKFKGYTITAEDIQLPSKTGKTYPQISFTPHNPSQPNMYVFTGLYPESGTEAEQKTAIIKAMLELYKNNTLKTYLLKVKASIPANTTASQLQSRNPTIAPIFNGSVNNNSSNIPQSPSPYKT